MKKVLFFTAIIGCLNIIAMDGPNNRASNKQKNHFDFDGQSAVVTKFIDKEVYKVMVDESIICCVDVVVYDPVRKAILTVIRRDEPAKGERFVIGGRWNKNEEPEAAAARKCLQEAGLNISPACVLQTYSTKYPKSQWIKANGEMATTHSVNTLVLVVDHPNSMVNLNFEHDNPEWISINTTVDAKIFTNEAIGACFLAYFEDALRVIRTHQVELEILYRNPNACVEISRDAAIRRQERARICGFLGLGTEDFTRLELGDSRLSISKQMDHSKVECVEELAPSGVLTEDAAQIRDLDAVKQKEQAKQKEKITTP